MQKIRKHLITLNSLTKEDLDYILECSLNLANGGKYEQLLEGNVVGLYFRKTSTRTRTAFSVAALKLGAQIISFGPHDLQENTGESVEDTARVLSGMLDCLVARTASDQREMDVYASQHRMSVVNAMSAQEHPTQALADLTTMLQLFGSLSGLRVLYVGEGNNTASALCRAIPRFAKTELYLYSPPGYELPPTVVAEGIQLAKATSSKVIEVKDLRSVPKEVDVVYTTRWQTTGTSKPDPDWRHVFAPYRVSSALMDNYPKALFLHDLPAHRGEEVDADVLESSKSKAFQQAENKMHSAAAVYQWCFS